MGLFDFPRIHFRGNVDLHVPTINNSYYFPLTLYDQSYSRPFLPPRLYFSSKEVAEAVQSNINPKPAIIPDPRNGYCYIEIAPINTIEILRTWCMTPLGSDPSSPDQEYIPYYQAADADLGNVEGASLLGNCPGYWNMWGDMSVQMSNVLVTGVQTYDAGEVKTWTSSDPDIPPDISPLLSAAFDLDTSPASGQSTALMVETLSSQSVYANIFCSRVNLYNKDNTSEVFLKARPNRFAALLYGTWRVLNWFPAMSGSARFCSSIQLDDLDQEQQSALLSFYGSRNAYDGRTLQGIFVSFTILEVFENRYNQNVYGSGQPIRNPAQASTIGSITPWYEGDMVSGVIGRNLISLNMSPVYSNTGMGQTIPVALNPAIASLRKLSDGNALFSVDMGNTWPEVMTPAFQVGKVQPAFRGDASFETCLLGNLSFRTGADASTEFASLAVDPAVNPLTKVAQQGCLFDFVLTDANQISAVENNFVQVYAKLGGQDKQVLQEATYMIATDDRGLYADEGDPAIGGYQVFDQNRVPCQLWIYQRGQPVTTPIQVFVAVYKVPEAANDPLKGPDLVMTQNLKNQDPVVLVQGNFAMTDNAVYYFVFDGQYPENKIPPFTSPGYTIMDTGSFAVLRVHPQSDYSQYIDPEHPNYTPPDFEVIYNEIFKLYDVVYPAMAQVLPFTREIWNNGTMAGEVMKRTDLSFWPSISYMPRSRELSASQRALIVAWANTFK